MIFIPQENLAAERLLRFRERSDVRDVANRYADWSLTPDGIQLSLQLAFLAMARLGNRLSRGAYRSSVRELAAKSGIPLGDFLTLAKCQLEVARCSLAGSGQIPFDPSMWETEDRGQ